MAKSKQQLALGLAYLTPNFIGFLLFTFLPVLAIFVVAFTKGDFTTEFDPATGTMSVNAVWCGVEHFQRLFQDERFWSSLWNTFFLMLSIPLHMALALGLALLLNQKIPGRVAYRTLLFLPTIAAGLALYMIWRQIYNQEFGLFNTVLSTLGIFAQGAGPDWLGDGSLAKPALVLMLVWIGMGGTSMVLYLAALQDISPTLYEAAAIDGAKGWDKFKTITWPALRPATFFIFTTNLIGGIQIFDQVLIMTEGGPEGSTSTILYYIYLNIYKYHDLGYAAALSVALFFVVLLITLGNWRVNRAAREAM